MKPVTVTVCVVVVFILGGLVLAQHRPGVLQMKRNTMKRYTVAERVAQFGDDAQKRWAAHFDAAGLTYPPERLTFIGLKDQRLLEVWAAGDDGVYRHLRTCPILGSSGGPGPKQRESDRQVPEGLYAIESLNPNSRFHLSLRINYPNAHDKARAREEGRTDLGGDIMIHGSNVSIGCLAMGDDVAEDLFILAAVTGHTKINVILAPTDLRPAKPAMVLPDSPAWVSDLYAQLREVMAAY